MPSNMPHDEEDESPSYSSDFDIGLASPASSSEGGAADRLCQYAGYDYEGKVPIASEAVAALSKDRLWNLYISKRRPAIIDGLLRDEQFKATKWTNLDYLAEQAGHAIVKIEPIHPAKGHFGTAMTRQSVAFGDYLEVLKDPDLSDQYYLTTQYDDSSEEEEDTGSEDDQFGMGSEGDGEAALKVLLAEARDMEGDAGEKLGLKRKRSQNLSLSSESSDAESVDGSSGHDSSASSSGSELSLTPEKDEIDPVLPSPTDALVNDFPAKPSMMGGLVLQQCNLWLGSTPKSSLQAKGAAGRANEGKSSGLHHDFHDNLYVLLSGRKRFLLFPPSAYPYLHPRGKLEVVHENGLIVYQDGDPDTEDREIDGDDDDEFNDGTFDPIKLRKNLLALSDKLKKHRTTLSGGAERFTDTFIRPDGLPRLQASRWRLRARLRVLRDLEESAAQTAGEGAKRPSQRKGKGKMTAEMELALGAVAEARREAEQEWRREQGEFVDDDDDVGQEDNEEENGLFGNAAEDDWSISSDLIRLSEDEMGDEDDEDQSTKPSGTEDDAEVATHIVTSRKSRINGNSSKSLVEDVSENADSDDGDEGDLSEIEEDELAGLLDDATTPLDLAIYHQQSSVPKNVSAVDAIKKAEKASSRPGKQELSPAPSESGASEEGLLTPAQLRDLKARFGPQGGQRSSELNLIASAADSADEDAADDSASDGGQELDVVDFLEQIESDDEDEENADQVLHSDDDSDTEDADSDAIDEGEAILAQLWADAAQEKALEGDSDSDMDSDAEDADSDTATTDKKEPRSFSIIKPADLHAHFGIGMNASERKRYLKQQQKKGKFESQDPVPLPGCPEPIEVHLEAGQMLYLPASWFHEVTSFSESPKSKNPKQANSSKQGPDFHMALNYWFHPPTQLSKLSPEKTAGGSGSRAAEISTGNAVQSESELGTADRPYDDPEVWDEIALAVDAQIQQAKEAAALRRAAQAKLTKKTSRKEQSGLGNRSNGKAAPGKKKHKVVRESH